MVKRLKPTATDRPRGILSSSDRELLLGESELKPQTKRRRRQIIRERVVNSLFDFWILVDYLSETDIEQIFEQDRRIHSTDLEAPPPYDFLHDHYHLGPVGQKDRATLAFKEALVDMVAFACIGADHVSGVELTDIVEEGMSKVLHERGKTAKVSTSDATIAQLVKYLEDGEMNIYDFKHLLSQDHNEVLKELSWQFEMGDPPDGPPPEWMIRRRSNEEVSEDE